MSTETGTSPLLGLMGFWMMMGLVSTLTLVLGGLYILYCMSRYASSMDRLASAVEELVKHQHGPVAEAQTPLTVPSVPSAPVPPVPPPAITPPAVPVPSATPYNTTGTNATGTLPPPGVPPVSGANIERQSDEYPH
jgi:hypothetical protein